MALSTPAIGLSQGFWQNLHEALQFAKDIELVAGTDTVNDALTAIAGQRDDN
jgi:hypothetical protein